MKLEKHINYIMEAHGTLPKKPSKAFRKWDGQTPYSIHPIWCAMTIAAETALDEKIKNEGIITLLYHDIPEDTNAELPEHSEREKFLIGEMTFQNGSQQEIGEIWDKPKEIRLYKLYDKVSNLLDANWMTAEKRAEYNGYAQKLMNDPNTKIHLTGYQAEETPGRLLQDEGKLNYNDALINSLK